MPYSSSLPAGSKCIVNTSDLRPTQFAVGYWEIGKRAEKIADKNGKKLLKYLEEHVGKIAIGPDGAPYLVDRHHLACIMLRTRKSPTIYAVVEANFTGLTMDNFWKEMAARKWIYPYDNNGKGPLDPKLLPRSIKDLADDNFRSLAWAVREQGGYKKTEEPFADFRWAEFFRARIPEDKAKQDMEYLVAEALKICHSAEAKDLPGYFAR